MCGNNHWILRQPGHVNKIDPWPGGPKSNFGNQRLPPWSSNKQIEEPQTAVLALLGLVSVAY